MTYIIRTYGGLGDVLLLTPALRAIKQQKPAAHITVYGTHPDHVEILRHNPRIDVLTLQKPARHLAWMLARQTIGFLSLRASQGHRFPYPPGFVERAIARVFAENKEVVRMQPAYGALAPTLLRRHATLLCGDLLGVEVDDRSLELFLTSDEQLEAKTVMDRYPRAVAIQVGANSSSNKNWPIAHWESLVRRNPQFTFVQFGLSHEPLVEGAIDLRGQTTIRQAFARLKFAKCLVAVESALAHAASAVGLPAIVLYGPTSPDVWAHRGNVVLQRDVRCSPCIDLLLNGACPYNNACLSGLTVDVVEHALRSRMASIAEVAA